ncbi:MAG TPA: pectin acetylesterase-family hydrolase [Anaeromyxobacter sp.]
MRPSPSRLAALALVALALACGGKKSPPTPPLTWTWVPIAGSVCNDGSPTGIGIEASPTPGADVIVFLDGGGACWDYLSCYTLHTATTGPFGKDQLDARVKSVAGTIFDRAAPGNPYKDYTFVFVPYCTGDVHSGDKTQTYIPATVEWHHAGRVNVANAFQYLGAQLEPPAKVVVSGSSAGGFGSLLAFTKAKATWPAAKAYLVDDSGPPLANIPSATVSDWVSSWGLDVAISQVCGTPCAGSPPSLAPIIPELAKANPSDRFALLSSDQDQTIRGFFVDAANYYQPMSAADFLSGLQALVSSMDAAPTANAHAFVVSGTSHTMLGNPAAFTSAGTALFDWLSKEVSDDPSWSSATPTPF